MIEIKNVSLTHNGTPILRDINLTIPKGGITALIGPNGAGKSSLLSLIARLQPLQSGRITVDGLPVDTTPGRVLAKKLAILRQELGIASRLTVEELVGFGRFPHHRGRPSAEDRDLIHAALEQFDLTPLAGRFLDTLSGGQRQRAAVAMAFCQGTDYVLLDEPLNNLDMFYARSLMQNVRDAADQLEKTIIVVLHDINHAVKANRIIGLRNGSVIIDASPSEVLTAPVLESMFGYWMRVETIDGLPVVLHHR